MTVTLQDAWMWTCPRCERRHFTAAVVTTLTDEQTRALIGDGADLEELAGEFVTAPEMVSCRACGNVYETTIDGEN